jgi:hypothetical protein
MPVVKCQTCQSVRSVFVEGVGPVAHTIRCAGCGATLAIVVLSPAGQWRKAPGYEADGTPYTAAEILASLP